MDSHQIKKGAIYTLHQNLEMGNISVQDKRGRHDQHNCVEQAVRDVIRRHIFSFVFEPIHYSRRGGNEQYLPAELNVSRMIRKFYEDHPQYEKKDWLYREIFASTGIQLRMPKSDTCRTCDRLRISIVYAENEDDDREATTSMHEHQNNADLGYKKMYEDIEESRVNPNFAKSTVLPHSYPSGYVLHKAVFFVQLMYL